MQIQEGDRLADSNFEPDRYVTKSYSIDILDDDEDVTLKFADLVKETSSR